jgi:hypothetical protein
LPPEELPDVVGVLVNELTVGVFDGDPLADSELDPVIDGVAVSVSLVELLVEAEFVPVVLSDCDVSLPVAEIDGVIEGVSVLVPEFEGVSVLVPELDAVIEGVSLSVGEFDGVIDGV